MPESTRKRSSRPLTWHTSCPFPRAKTIPHDMTSTTQVRMAVPRFDSTPSMPTFLRMEVSAAKTAESTALLLSMGTTLSIGPVESASK